MKICENGRRRGETPPPISTSARRTAHENSLRQLVEARLIPAGDDAARGELAAGGVDVAPARAADEGADALRFEHRLERLHALFGRRAVWQLVRGVVRDEVDFGAQRVAVEEPRETARVLVRVVHPVEHDVLEREALAGLERLLELLAG